MYLSIILALSLAVAHTVGMSPLKTTAKLTLDPKFVDGTVCLFWESDDAASSDCWEVLNGQTQRTWNKALTLRTGTWVVWSVSEGRDAEGHRMSVVSPQRRVEVY